MSATAASCGTRAPQNRHIKAEGKAPAAYKYPHDFEGHHVDQEYIPTSARYYKPGTLGYEDTIGKRMKAWEAARGSQTSDT